MKLKLLLGTLIRKIADDMLNKANDDWVGKKKLFLYSAHELNIVSVLQTLKVWQPHIPEYSSAIILELREDRKNHYVQVCTHIYRTKLKFGIILLLFTLAAGSVLHGYTNDIQSYANTRLPRSLSVDQIYRTNIRSTTCLQRDYL